MTAAAFGATLAPMPTYYPELLTRTVPRYTSFPTAAEFAPIATEVHRAAIAGVTGAVSLYVHIPFCEKICWYCGCNTSAIGRRDRLESYGSALTREVQMVAGLLPRNTTIGHVAFGGGSPNALAPCDFVGLVQTLTVAFGLIDTQWSIELDPRLMNAEWEMVLAGVGIKRASLGVQTFSPHIQRAIGRMQDDETIARGVERLRRAGVTSLNFDLMYGLPGQSLADLEASLRRSCELGADRIALFGYAHVPQMIARQRRIDSHALPDQAARFAMAALGHAVLVDAGYTAVGFDHFARPGDPLAQAACSKRLHRNFQGFTEDQATTVIGLGASAISCFDQALTQNAKSIADYRAALAQSNLATALGCLRSADDQRLGAAIEGLLCRGRIDLAMLPSGLLAGDFSERLSCFVDRGLADQLGSELIIRPAGLPYARSIAAILDPYRQDAAWRFSAAI